jgi:uncharacterized protein YbjT (DUF2867 family)
LVTRALLFGATGLVGGHCLDALIKSPRYERVVTVGRREIERRGNKHVHRVLDFARLDPFDSLERADDVFCCLGTTIEKAGSRAEFRKVDFDYVLRAGKFAKKTGAAQFLVVSAIGANPESALFYNRIKGETEAALRALELPALHVFRPSVLLGSRQEFRLGERLVKLPLLAFGPLMLGPLRRYRLIEADVVARVMLCVAARGQRGVHIYESERIAALSRELQPEVGPPPAELL